MNKLVVVISLLCSSTVFANQFKCEGHTLDENGNTVRAEIILTVNDTFMVITESNGTAYGLTANDLTYDENYRPSAKYAGYYRYNVAAGVNSDWNDVLIQKPMADNKRAKSGEVVFQGTVEDGGIAAYFDSCTRLAE
jgi:hypothetical protein